jgi:hypothetical protein
MTNNKIEEGIQAFIIVKEQLIEAPVAVSFKALLEELGAEGTGPEGANMSMKIEAWPGGRWYRDLGNNNGHLWAHVQVIKTPNLLELSGPFFMSYPAVNHLQYRLSEEGKTTKLVLTHRAMGQIEVDHREGVTKGWHEWNEKIKKRAEQAAREQK